MRTANNRKLILAVPDARPGQEVRARVEGFRHTTFFGRPVGVARPRTAGRGRA
jgi:hypothetical protein